MELNSEQQLAFDIMTSGKSMFLTGSAGTGKCLGFNTPVMMSNGRFEMVQDIKTGDKIMGDDGTFRNIIGITSGVSELYRVVQTKGDDYIVNNNHILSLKVGYTSTSGTTKKKNLYKIINGIKYRKNEIVDITIKDYIKLSKSTKTVLKGFKTGVKFVKKDLLLDPYTLGLWIGDGNSHNTGFTNQDSTILHYLAHKLPEYDCYLHYTGDRYLYNFKSINRGDNSIREILKKYNLINNKCIPDDYKYNSRDNQLRLLAGILDTDGYYDIKGHCYDIVQKNYTIAKDIEYMTRCLGLSSYVTECKKGCMYKGEYVEGVYYRQCIYGNGIEEIPCLTFRKKAIVRSQIKNNLHTGITVENIGIGNYYGFETDGNHRFLIGDFTVTHNSHVVQRYYSHAVKTHGSYRVFKTSSTGVSAILIGGMTLHKYGGIFIGEGTTDELIKKMSFSAKDRWRDTKVLFIDEISMIHPVLFDKLDTIAKKLRRNEMPFGGIQVICSGDFFQLSPISNDGEDRFCFESKSWDPLIRDRSITLSKIMRQSDEKFQSLLTDLKYGKINDENKELLESRVGIELLNEYGIEPTILFSKNADVNYINDKKLRILLEKEEGHKYTAQYEILYNKTKASKINAIKKISDLTKDFIPDEIVMCIGCQVVFKKNISEIIANGTRGIVSGFVKPNDLSEYYPEVTLLNGTKFVAVPIEFEYEILHEYKILKKQIPIKLAFACSIHSSQGSSLDYVKADLGSSIFAYGQFYVCASRVRTLEGLSLIDFDPRSIKAHPKVLKKYPPKEI